MNRIISAQISLYVRRDMERISVQIIFHLISDKNCCTEINNSRIIMNSKQ